MNFGCIDETSYEINNLDIECSIIIFSELKINIGNLPVNIKEIWLNNLIKNPNIKIPFGCKIKRYELWAIKDYSITNKQIDWIFS